MARILSKQDTDTWKRLDYRSILDGMKSVFDYALEHPSFRVERSDWMSLEDCRAFQFRVLTADDNIKEEFVFTLTDLDLLTKEKVIQRMDSFRKHITNWWEQRHRMIEALLGRRNNMCEFYPKEHEDCGGVCHAGSEISGSGPFYEQDLESRTDNWRPWTCSAKYSKTCDVACKARGDLRTF